MSLARSALRCWTPSHSLISLDCIASRRYSSQRSEPLRILFCGSDAFSAASLSALFQEKLADPEGIKSIDVLCRPGKPTGRSLKVIREVPIKAVAQSLGLRVHERDTFTAWNLPTPDQEPINLVVAVSFGLFVPPRILKSTKYGGVNVHPSLLPQYRGSSPIQYSLLQGDSSTGVTLQTLSPDSFDHGHLLSQTEPFDIPPNATYSQLLDLISPVGANLLAKGIRDRLFVPPVVEHTPNTTPTHLVHARKITPGDREINWQDWDAASIARRFRALGSLWSHIFVHSRKHEADEGWIPVRVRFEDIEEVETPTIFKKSKTQQEWKTLAIAGDASFLLAGITPAGNGSTGTHRNKVALRILKEKSSILIATKTGAIRVKIITIPGKRKAAARQAVESIHHQHIEDSLNLTLI